MNIKNVRHIKKLKELGYPLEKMLIVGSGIMALYGIKDNDDIDIWATRDVFNKIRRDPRFLSTGKLYKTRDDTIEVGAGVVGLQGQKVEDYLKRAVKANGFYFWTLNDLMKWKKMMGRPKDLDDIQKINDYVKRNPRMKLQEFLNLIQEVTGVGDLHEEIRKFLLTNPSPTDEQVHEFADSIGAKYEEVERHMFTMLADYIKKDVENEPLTTESTLQEIFVQMGEINSMPASVRRDMQMLRLAIIAEYDAANLYEEMAELTSNRHIRRIMLDIANEEKEHVGEFEFLLEHIDPDHEKHENEGEEEAMELTGLGEPPNEED
jgi:hypothetical protein